MAGFGYALVLMALATLVAAIVWFVVWATYVERKTTEFVEWLVERGNFGTKEIVNATVRSRADVETLKAVYDEWHDIIILKTKWFCLPSDASRLEFIDIFEIDRIKDTADGWGDGHLRRMAMDLVQRIRELGRRLDNKQTRLRRIRHQKSVSNCS